MLISLAVLAECQHGDPLWHAWPITQRDQQPSCAGHIDEHTDMLLGHTLNHTEYFHVKSVQDSTWENLDHNHMSISQHHITNSDLSFKSEQTVGRSIPMHISDSGQVTLHAQYEIAETWDTERTYPSAVKLPINVLSKFWTLYNCTGIPMQNPEIGIRHPNSRTKHYTNPNSHNWYYNHDEP